jgi:Fe-S-cluster containining protein
MGTGYETEEAVRYYRSEDGIVRRTGNCRAECGACCEYMILPLHPNMLRHKGEKLDDWIKWAEYHGVEIIVDAKEIRAKVPLKCEKLQEDKSCGVYGTDERPRMCSTTPRHPLDMEGLEDVCSYKFEVLEAKD